MFSTYCPRHESEVLLTFGRLRGLANTPAGIVLRYECWCGETIDALTGTPASCSA